MMNKIIKTIILMTSLQMVVMTQGVGQNGKPKQECCSPTWTLEYADGSKEAYKSTDDPQPLRSACKEYVHSVDDLIHKINLHRHVTGAPLQAEVALEWIKNSKCEKLYKTALQLKNEWTNSLASERSKYKLLHIWTDVVELRHNHYEEALKDCKDIFSNQQKEIIEQQRTTIEQQRTTIEQQRTTIEQQRTTIEQQRTTISALEHNPLMQVYKQIQRVLNLINGLGEI